MVDIHRFPVTEVVKTTDGNGRACFNVLCKEYGNSGYLYTSTSVEAWINKHTKQYVLLDDHLGQLAKTERQ